MVLAPKLDGSGIVHEPAESHLARGRCTATDRGQHSAGDKDSSPNSATLREIGSQGLVA